LEKKMGDLGSTITSRYAVAIERKTEFPTKGRTSGIETLSTGCSRILLRGGRNVLNFTRRTALAVPEACVVGTLATFWTIERVSGFFV
jgi:hypothetical protein